MPHGFFRLPAAIGLLLALAVAAASANEPLDVRKLPRLEGGTDAFTPTAGLAAYDLPAPAVQSRAAATIELLAKDGWQRYVHPSVRTTTGESVVIATLKKGSYSVRVVVAHATRDALATRITYEARPLAHNVPFPVGAADFGYDPEKPQLYAHMPPGAEAPRDAMMRDMQAAGWQLSPTRTRAGSPIFTKPDGTQVYLSITRINDGRTRITVLPVEGHHLRDTAAAPASRGEPADMKQLLDMANQMMRESDRLTAERPARPERLPPAPVPGEAPLQAMTSSFGAPIPIPDTANEIKFDGGAGQLDFRSSSSLHALGEFYRAEMKRLGWQEQRSVINNEKMVVLNFSKSRESVSFTLMARREYATVRAHGRSLITAPPPDEARPGPGRPSPAQSASRAGSSPEQVSGDKLTVSDQRGLIVPSPNSSTSTERTPYRQEATARVPASVADILAFYRRELATRGWTEAPGGAAGSAADQAQLRYAAPDGPALLTLTRLADAGVTEVRLTLRREALAKKDGIAPSPGQSKIVFGNMEDTAAVIKIQDKTIRVAPGTGGKEPNGPKLDLPPGTYKLTVQLGKQPPVAETITLEADRTMGVLVGPRGALALPLY